MSYLTDSNFFIKSILQNALLGITGGLEPFFGYAVMVLDYVDKIASLDDDPQVLLPMNDQESDHTLEEAVSSNYNVAFQLAASTCVA